MQSQQAYEEHGVEVETLWEYAQRRRKADEADVRRYAEEQRTITPVVSYVLRQRMASVVGLVAAVAILLKWATLGGMLGSVIAGLFTFALVVGGLRDLFPTPPVRIARMACNLDVDVTDLWPKGSDEFKDYVQTYRLQNLRRARRGEPMGWIKCR